MEREIYVGGKFRTIGRDKRKARQQAVRDAVEKQRMGQSDRLSTRIISDALKKQIQDHISSFIINGKLSAARIPMNLLVNGYTDDEKRKKIHLDELIDLLSEQVGDNLYFDIGKNVPVFFGTPLKSLDLFYASLLKAGYFCTKGAAEDALRAHLDVFVRDPLQEKFDIIREEKPDPAVDIDKLAERYFPGVRRPEVANVLFKRWLISAVARRYQPGCEVHSALILVGPQGYGKTTFFRVLADGNKIVPDYYCGDATLCRSSLDHKDQLLKAHNSWICDLQEIDGTISKAEASDLKSMISTSTDRIRAPYAREAELLPRRFVFCGATNDSSYLRDAENRRFFTIELTQPVDIEKFREERDEVVAAAIKAYFEGQQWWLTSEETALLHEHNNQYTETDPWTNIIVSYVAANKTQEVFTAKELITIALSYTPDRIKISDGKRLKRVMDYLGFEYRNGKYSTSYKHTDKSRQILEDSSDEPTVQVPDFNIDAMLD